ncbi:phosphonate metabolism protein PhnP [Methylicorpusculum sp.]|uniref:phosphonate metabolism protein PhnP n=1 Tax=Methylicorpusculum sp. TaxID=2713644 RepID=UPI002AB9F738|nr:phosphonate metabolism protein PhnP [Methylicorpusculum sp.]MDZ4152663.1 phosphonate metabolism protein PhnP [Methylicorpusculum sp.]
MSDKWFLRFLGTGNAPGVPVHGCYCEICRLATFNSELRREPCSALLTVGGQQILLDAGLPDLKQRFPDGVLHSILLTHYHPDHVQGLFPLRWGVGQTLPVYGPDDREGCGDLFKNHGILDFNSLQPFQSFEMDGLKVTAVPLVHSKKTLGYCFEQGGIKLAYLTDTVGLPRKTQAFLRDWQPDLLVLDCSFPPLDSPPKNHNDLNLALAIHAYLNPRQTLLTHIGHDLDIWLNAYVASLPADVAVARDKDRVELETIDGVVKISMGNQETRQTENA